MAKTSYIVEVEHEEGEESEVLEMLQSFGKCTKYEPTAAPKTVTAPTTAGFDAYGNPYDQNTERDKSRDAYGNPYKKSDKSEPAPAKQVKRDAYGNPY